MTMLDKCKNCGEVPVIKKQKGKYKYRLEHKESSTCVPTFCLETHQTSIKKCVKAWHDFQGKYNKE